MLSFEEALSRVLTDVSRLGRERVSAMDAVGRVLAEELTTPHPLPEFDYSAMDGYALASDQLSGDGPWRMPVVGESQTGHPAPPLTPGSSCRIFTGAPIPEGADTVEMQENVTREGDEITIEKRPAAGKNVRLAGEDLELGGVATVAGTRLTPFHLGLAAALDRTQLVVARRPRVTVLCTGDELRPAGAPRRPGSIPESNGVAVRSLAHRAGADARLAPLTGDDQDATVAALEEALADSDLVVTIGGVSVGDHDVVRPALEQSGVKLDFWKVNLKPGKPLALGRRGSVHTLGLPGNPVSAQVTFVLFGLPLLRALMGENNPGPNFETGKVGAALRQKPGRRNFVRVRLEGNQVFPLSKQSSGNVLSLANADALAVIPETVGELPAGADVQLLRL